MIETPEPPEGAVIVGRSELADFRQCPLKWHLRYRLGYYRPRTDGDNSSPSQGTRFHSVLQAIYEAIRSGTRDVTKLHAVGQRQIAQLREDLELREDQVAQLLWMLEGYLERWSVNGLLDPEFDVIAIEQTMFTPVWDLDTGEGPWATRYWLRWTADAIFRHRGLGRVVIVDTKCVDAPNSDDYDLDDQLGLYIRGWNRLFPDDPALYGISNKIRRKKLVRPMTLTERVWRDRTARTNLELDEIERDALATVRVMYSSANLRRPSSSPNVKNCGWSCDFKEAHLRLRKTGGDWGAVHDLLAHTGFVRDPENDPALGNRNNITP